MTAKTRNSKKLEFLLFPAGGKYISFIISGWKFRFNVTRCLVHYLVCFDFSTLCKDQNKRKPECSIAVKSWGETIGYNELESTSFLLWCAYWKPVIICCRVHSLNSFFTSHSHAHVLRLTFKDAFIITRLLTARKIKLNNLPIHGWIQRKWKDITS